MTPSDLNNLYEKLRQRVSIHVPDCCAHISVRLPSDFNDELAFYLLVIWAYALLNEAAKTPIKYLTNLPPLRRDDDSLRNDVSSLRTYVVHNLNIEKKRDRKTYESSHRWFKNACGQGTPLETSHYQSCCRVLAENLETTLNGAIQACDLLDDEQDQKRLVGDLQKAIDSEWDAHLFDPFVEKCASRLGNPALDLLAIRKRHLEAWRLAVKEADENERERALELRIEATLLTAIGDALPLNAKEASSRLAIAGSDALVAALLLLRDARRFRAVPLPEIIERVSLEVGQS